MDVKHLRTNGVQLRLLTAGPADGPLVLLLHGFPDRAVGWRHQIPWLASRGWFVVAPDQRGYPGSDKPPRVRDYAADRLTGDVLGLIDAFGRDRAHVVGHDWGGAVAWRLALDHPDRVASLTAMNMPHPSVLARAILTPSPQTLRSWYTFALQVPGVPERLLRANDFALLARALTVGTTRGAFDERDLEEYRRGWREPDALTGMIAWYRAAARFPRPPRHARVTVPTLILWGDRDPALGVELVEPSAERCDDVRVEIFHGAGHFVQRDEADRVNERLVAFLEEIEPPAARPRPVTAPPPP